MATHDLLRRLQWRRQPRLVLLHAPVEVRACFDPVPPEVVISTRMARTERFVAVFAREAAVLERDAPRVLAAVATDDDPLVWFCYPKRTSRRFETDLSRDVGWEPLTGAGWRPVRQISIDDDWSALRFRPEPAMVGSTPVPG